MIKKLVLVSMVLALIFVLLNIQITWVTADMGWCKNYAYGLKIGEDVIFDIPSFATSGCV